MTALELDEIPAEFLRLGGDAGKRRKLLLVDDAETVLHLEQLALSDTYDILFARNGKEAVDAASSSRPDGILLDYSMPIMNGAEALKAISQNRATSSIPVIMVTSEKDPVILKSCWESGCKAILGKPIDRRLLRETVLKFVPP